MEITNYDKWRFRRCLETLNRYGCGNGNMDLRIGKCEKCSYNISNNRWSYLHIRLMCDGNMDRIDINNVLE